MVYARTRVELYSIPFFDSSKAVRTLLSSHRATSILSGIGM